MKTASTSISGLNLRPPYHVMISTGQNDWTVDRTTNRLFEYDLDGKFLYSWGLVRFFPEARVRFRWTPKEMFKWWRQGAGAGRNSGPSRVPTGEAN